MNGFHLAVGFLTLTCGAGPPAGDLSQTSPPGTGRTVLVIPDSLPLDIRQLPARGGPVIRIETGRGPVRASGPRFFYCDRQFEVAAIRLEWQGKLLDVWIGPEDFSTSQYPTSGQGRANPPRFRPLR